jgi:hypothetical protein
MVGIKDEPNAEGDGLGVNSYAIALAKFIKQSETPITIGVQGPWGSGKTSLLYSVWDEISKDDSMAQIWVNSWEHSLMSSSEETLIKITNEIAGKIVRFDDGQKRGDQLKKITGKLLMGSLAAGAALTAGAKGADLVTEMLSDDNESPIKQLKKELEASVRSVFDRSTNSKKRFIIYIDDLDRIEPSDAVSLLELLKNIFSVNHCVFVLAIDYEVVVKGLSKKFGERNSQNEREYKAFFDKVIQLTFKMPMSNYDIGNYVYQLLDKTKFLEGVKISSDDLKDFFQKIVSLTVQGNPRSIKRLVNSLTLMAITAEQVSEKGSVKENLNSEKQLLFALTCLQIAMPDIYGLLAKETDFLSWNEDTLTENLGLVEADDKFDKLFSSAKDLEEFDEEWEQVLLRFGYFKGYSISEITNCSRLLSYVQNVLLKPDSDGYELLRSVIKRTSVTSIGNDGVSSSNNDPDPVYNKFWLGLFSYLKDKHSDFDLPNKIPTKDYGIWVGFKNGYKVLLLFRKQKKFVSVKLENYKNNVSVDSFQQDTKEIISADTDFSLDVQEDRKRMDVYAIRNDFNIENENTLEPNFEWIKNKLDTIINNTRSIQ